MSKKDDNLAPERITRFEGLTEWVWDTNEAGWEDGFAALEKYIAREGHAKPPGGYTDEDGYPLGNWVRTQRKLYNAEKLPPERIARLEDLPRWVWNARA